jgi:hypothetical protein
MKIEQTIALGARHVSEFACITHRAQIAIHYRVSAHTLFDEEVQVMDEHEKRKIRNQRYYSRHRDQILRSVNLKYKEDEEYRESALQRAREKYREDESYRAATSQRAKERYRRSRGGDSSG